MNSIRSIMLFVGAVLFCAPPLMAQEKRVSPHDVIGMAIDSARDRLTVIYGRPFTKNPHGGEMRKIWGGLVPFGKVWRTGADEATLLITQQPIVMGDTTIPAGAYTLYTLPNEDGTAKLIINKQIGQWGTVYDPSQDLARVDLKKEDLDTSVDQFTMSLSKDPSGGGVLKMAWEKTQYSIAFTVKK